MNLTVKQLKKACNKYPYLLIRTEEYALVGMNSGLANIGENKVRFDDQLTKAVSYIPCSLMEYISNKTPFI